MDEITSTQSAIACIGAHTPALVDAAGDRARIRFLEFFAAQIRNRHTRRAYALATQEFLAWCERAGVASITAYLKNGGTLEKAAIMANHASTRTTQLYDRRRTRWSAFLSKFRPTLLSGSNP